MSIYSIVKTTLFGAYTRTDLTPWRRPVSTNRRIYGFYHVYCAPGWQTLVGKQLDRLRSSGLAGATATLYVSIIVQNDTDQADFLRMAEGIRIELVSISSDGRLFEYPALEALRRRSLEEDCRIYYFHTKGVSFHTAKGQTRRFRRFMRNVEAWRNLMEHFLMDEWQVAANVLDDAYDTYGCYRYPPKPAPYNMYAGNFWWADASYLRTLPKLHPEQMSSDRMYAEQWLFEAKPNAFTAFDHLAVLYRVYLPESLYLEENPPIADRVRFTLRFNVTKAMKKIFKYNYVKRSNERYQDR